MNVLSLFSGVGGLDLGIKIAVPEAKVVGYIEADGYCQRVLAARMADGSLDAAPIHGDITRFDGRPWRGSVDLVCGGFPCQDISNAGRRDGIKEGNRSGLWFEFERVIREVEPRWVFIENVAALLTRGVDIVLGSLAESGFDAEWGVFSAADVGAPHLRKRLFVLAYAQAHNLGNGGFAGAGQESAGRGAVRTRSGGLQTGVVCSPLAHTERLRQQRRGDAGDMEGAAGPAEGEGLQRERSRSAAGDRCAGDATLADAEGQCGQLRTAEGERPGRPAGSDGAVADGGSERLEGNGRAGATARPAGRSGGADMVLPLFPPGPADRDAWAAILAGCPELAPATEHPLRGVAARLPHRVDRLKALGNAVVPSQAALALAVLSRRFSRPQDAVTRAEPETK